MIKVATPCSEGFRMFPCFLDLFVMVMVRVSALKLAARCGGDSRVDSVRILYGSALTPHYPRKNIASPCYIPHSITLCHTVSNCVTLCHSGI